MRSIKQQREFIVELDEGFSFLEAPYIELLDWAERARVNIREMQIRLGNYEYCAFNDSCQCVFCVAAKLLKELPED
jgi:hypothetical protein